MTHPLRIALGAAALFALAGCVEETTSSPAPSAGMPAVGSSSDVTSFEGARAGQVQRLAVIDGLELSGSAHHQPVVA